MRASGQRVSWATRPFISKFGEDRYLWSQCGGFRHVLETTGWLRAAFLGVRIMTNKRRLGGWLLWLAAAGGLAVGMAVGPLGNLAARENTTYPELRTFTEILHLVESNYVNKVEGKKPSFFEDIQLLMIGPAWLMSFIYDRFGIKY